MKPKLLLCLAFVLSGGLFGCSTITSNHTAALPIKNTTNGLVPIFDAAMPVPDWKDYEFLTNALIDDDPPACPGLQFTGAFQLSLGLREGPVLMIEFTLADSEPSSKWLAFFVGNTNQGYRLILPKLNLFFGKYQPYPQSPVTNTIYVCDVDGDGQQELISFGMDGTDETVEQLNVCCKYERSLGVFEDYQVPDKSAPVSEGWVSVMTLSPETYRQLRKQGPIHLVPIGYNDNSDVSQAQKHFYKPNGKSLLQMAADIQAATDNPPPSAYGTKIFDYSNGGDSPVADDVVVTGLGKSYSIHAAADSWLALVQKVKPTFAWNGCDMMWIENDTNSQPQFILDEAYIYQPTNRQRQWVLVKDKRESASSEEIENEQWWRQFSGHNLYAVANLCDSVPSPSDGGYYGNYAVIKSSQRKFGIVYEIGWQKLMANGTCLCEDNRRIYIWKDRTKHWHFLGEGPGEEWERGGGQTVESKVVWKNSPTNDLPFQIRFHSEETTSPYTVSDGDTDTNNPPDVTICYDSALVTELPAQQQSIGYNPYLLAEKDDTLEKITLRLGFFMPGWNFWPDDEAKEQAEKKRILKTWRASIVRLNPNLPQHGKISEGTRVDLEMVNQ